MILRLAALASALALAACTAPAAANPPLALPELPAQAGGALTVTSPAFKDGQPIPRSDTQYGANLFPGLAWSGAPPQVRSFAIVLQDTDPPDPRLITIVHWVAFNIPPDVSSLPAGMSAPPPGAAFGANMRGKGGYLGPHPPVGDKPHHYHFQVFALDTALKLRAGAQLEDLIAAMKNRVLASGELVGTYEAPR